jgi:hypothetical protein
MKGAASTFHVLSLEAAVLVWGFAMRLSAGNPAESRSAADASLQ